MSIQSIRQKAIKLLKRAGILSAPVDVESVARFLGIEVRKSPAKDEISGFLLKLPGTQPVIGVNTSHHPNRQRFTIGHEIGHFVLHNFDKVHVDNYVVKLRGPDSSTGENQEEREANRFAAELLMPKEFLDADLPHFLNDLLDDHAMQQLAKKYQVSVQAMTTRLNSLKYIQSDE